MKIDGLLIYPKLGSMDSMVVDLPLSIIYAAADSVKRGYVIKMLDLRCENSNWRETLRSFLDEGVLVVGVSVMTGEPMRNSREVSSFIKANYKDTRIVWGGPHVALVRDTINEDFIDYIICGYGSEPFAELIKKLKTGDNEFSEIKGLSFKEDAKVFHNPRSTKHEMLNYRDLPYHLIDVTKPAYSRSYMGRLIFSMFSSIGCPYQCTFCVSPAVNMEIEGKKWLPYKDEAVLEHMEYVIREFGVDHICFLDDTCFPDLKRMQRLFEGIIEHGIKASLEFRGARVNEIDRMDDSFIRLMIKAGVRVLKVGCESASDRLLKAMQKGITKEQILRVNKKLSSFPELVVDYNFFYGAPGETYDDLVETKDAILQIIRENPSAYISFGSDWKPIPGSKMLEMAEREYNFKAPKNFNEWIGMDSSDAKSKIKHPWYTRKHNNLIKLLQVSSFVIDDKIIKESPSNNTLFFSILRVLSKCYKPIALFRLKHNFHQILIEYNIWHSLIKLLPYLVISRKSVANAKK